MTRPRTLLVFSGLVVVSLALVAAPAAADWLVTAEGARIATRGPWTVSRGQVVFTAANGTLSTLRLADVDVAASHEATAAAEAELATPEPAAPAARPRPIAVITDRDIPRGRPQPDPATDVEDGDPAATADADAAPEARETQCLEVTWWRAREEDDAVVLHGTLRNEGPHMATDLVVEIEVENRSNPGEWFRATAFLDDTTLAPGLTTTFRAVFPMNAAPHEPRFTVRCIDVAVRGGAFLPTPPGADDADGAPPSAGVSAPSSRRGAST